MSTSSRAFGACFVAFGAGLLLAQTRSQPTTSPQAPPSAEQPASDQNGDAEQPTATTDAGTQPTTPAPAESEEAPDAAAPDAGEPPTPTPAEQQALQNEQTMRAIDQRLAILNQQAAAAQQLREEMADISRNNVAIRNAAQDRITIYNAALQEIAAVDYNMALYGASAQQGRVEALQQSLEATRNNADASAGEQETVSLDRALEYLATAESSLSNSDYVGARYNLYASRQLLQTAVSAAGSAITVK